MAELQYKRSTPSKNASLTRLAGQTGASSITDDHRPTLVATFCGNPERS
jgi:hypothetical protein